MFPQRTPDSSIIGQRSTRRAFLLHSAIGSLAVALLNACGSGSDNASVTTEMSDMDHSDVEMADSDVEMADSDVEMADAPAPTAAPATVGEITAPTDAPAPTAAPATIGEITAPAEVPPAVGGFGETTEMALSFSYVPSGGGGRIHNPYIAVWIQDTAGTPIRTLDVMYQEGRKGQKWLRDLKRWYNADQARISSGGTEILDTVSSPTRLPGVTELVWDGKNDLGEFVPAGTYVLTIEAAREKGPYDVISQEISFTGAALEQQLPDTGDLQQVMVNVRPLA